MRAPLCITKKLVPKIPSKLQVTYVTYYVHTRHNNHIFQSATRKECFINVANDATETEVNLDPS